MEFHISRAIRERIGLDDLLFSFSGNVIFANVTASRKLAERLNMLDKAEVPAPVSGAALFAMGLIDELSHALVARYRRRVDPRVLADGLKFLTETLGGEALDKLLLRFTEEFPNVAVYRGELTAAQWLRETTEDMPNREAALEELLLLWLANSNPAFTPFTILFGDKALAQQTSYPEATAALPGYLETRPPVESELGTLLEALRAPMLASPDSLTGQLEYIRKHWAPVLGDDLNRALLAIDVLREEEIAVWMQFHPAGPVWHRHGDPGRSNEGFIGDEYVGFDDEFVTLPDGTRRRRYATDYQAPLDEYEAFSADQAWMPTVVLIAKNTYVWLEQLSKKYGRHIHRLDQIPDEELYTMSQRGITGLWLIGLWERSPASRIIKRLRGNTDAVASAYSLKDYAIAEDLGGEAAYLHLRDHAAKAGLRLASDMVPNHMGIDSDWVIEHPEWFLSRPDSPFPVYRFEGPDVSTDSRVEIKIEDHYYDHTDAAVVFRLRHHDSGTTRFVYHGNDGTTFAWNDTAQLDYSKAAVREHVIQVILDVARRFPIIRFDAAMVLAKRHVQRLWFPVPGAGGSIPSRAEYAMSDEEFNALMPHEFWREVVDRVAVEVPGTLLLAEAFWLLEGYFVRTLGMHRVYNSAFMNMLRDEENAKYRSYLKKTVEFDPDILKRYVNFMSNPDERTAVDQFGSGDKYFGVSVLLATLPGLPMFGHGQIEGFTERYGMDFKQAMLDEHPNEDLIARHQGLIAPLLKRRALFAESTHFLLYDFWNGQGGVDENVFAYSNRLGKERGLIVYNNCYQSTRGTIHHSVGFLDKASGALQQRSLAFGLDLPVDDSIVLAYTDRVSGLEYLRRATHLRDFGLTVDLRGYQHLALLNWRELQSTAAQPWDRLCDALNGSGVYSVEEALSKLQIRPVLEALRQAVSVANISTFETLASEFAASFEGEASQAGGSHRPLNADELTLKPEPVTGEAATQVLPAPKATETESRQPDERLTPFLEQAHVFADRIAHLSELDPATLEQLRSRHAQEPAEAKARTPRLPVLASNCVLLPVVSAMFSDKLTRAAEVVFPSLETRKSSRRNWSPALVYCVFQALLPEFSPIEVFERLNLRWAIAETFSSVGLEGEAAWHAAAQVRVLLRFAGADDLETTLRSEEFWRDPDVRWLAGVNAASGAEYINQERFEELLCWLQLPAILASTPERAELLDCVARISSDVTGYVTLLQRADYRYEPFLQALNESEPETVEAGDLEIDASTAGGKAFPL